MHQNAIHVRISWYNKICWFPVKKCWSQQNSGGVSRDSYIIWIFVMLRYNCAKFHHCRICVTEFREGAFLPPPIHEQPQKCPSWIGLNNTKIYRQKKKKIKIFRQMLVIVNLKLGNRMLLFFTATQSSIKNTK